jgi:hypothetical protein
MRSVFRPEKMAEICHSAAAHIFPWMAAEEVARYRWE